MVDIAGTVIIGGGITGCSIAYQLAKKGVKNVVVIEKSYLASGATGACGAGIRQQWGTDMNCRISKLACEMFENCREELEYEWDIEFKQGGYLLLASTDKEVNQFKKNITLQNSLGIPSGLLSLEDAKEIVPGLNTEDYLMAAFCHKDGHLNPFHTTNAYARAAERLGVKFHKFTEVKKILVEHGRVRGVVTDQGTIHTNIVVNAAGAQSHHVAAMAGIEVPIYAERHQILVTEPVEPILPCMLMSFSKNFYCQQVPHGGVLMGRGDENEPRDGNINSSWHFMDEMARTITRVMPKLGNARIIRSWAGLYDMSPDRQPILGSVDELDGFYQAIGFSGHGFMFGPATGLLMAEYILGEKPTLDISPLHLNRFERGEMIFEPSVV